MFLPMEVDQWTRQNSPGNLIGRESRRSGLLSALSDPGKLDDPPGQGLSREPPGAQFAATHLSQGTHHR